MICFYHLFFLLLYFFILCPYFMSSCFMYVIMLPRSKQKRKEGLGPSEVASKKPKTEVNNNPDFKTITRNRAETNKTNIKQDEAKRRTND